MIDVKTKIHSFFIFNSNFGPKEGEELKRVLFFHPSQVSSDGRKLQVGLCEAVVKFMSTFSSEPCEALQTQTKRHIFYQPEKDYWMVLVVRIPYTTKALSAIGESRGDVVEPSVMFDLLKSAYKTYKMFMGPFPNIPPDEIYSSCEKFFGPVVRIPCTTKALSAIGESRGDVIEPSVMFDLLKSAYKMFKIFVGPFQNIPPDEIYSSCEKFFRPYIKSKNLSNDITDIIQGISYLPLDKNSFFKVLCFIDLVEVTYPDFKCISFVYNEQLIWNALSTNDMLTLYQYLVQKLLPEQIEKELQGGAVAAAQRHGRFIMPRDGIRTQEDLQVLTKVHVMLEDEQEEKEYYLIIYRTLSATVCFTVDVNTNLKLETFKSLDAFIGPKLSSIASAISEQCALHALQTAQLSSNDHKFVYFNRLNLAFKTSSPVNKLLPSTTIKPEVLSIIAGVHADRKSLGNYGEVIIKTPDEYWITGKSSNEREFYVIIQEKNANLKEIADEVKRICDVQMKGIFFYPI